MALSADAIARQLQRTDVDLEVVASTGSTNADLMDRARAQAPSRVILRATARQTAGRGRRGRAWHASAGGSLLFSLALPWSSAPDSTSAVTLACGVAVAECLHAHGVEVQLKWPNDILLDGRKLAGILTEIAEDPAGARTLVIGMGLNLLLDPVQRQAIEQPVAELAERLGREAAHADRELWLARLAAALIDAAVQFDACGFGAMREQFNARFAYLGRRVSLHGAGQPAQSGIARGVDDQGRLLLECHGMLFKRISGEMGLRADFSGADEHREQT